MLPLTCEPFGKLSAICKVRSRHQEFEQRPQLRQVILQRSTSEEQPPERAKHEQNIPPLRLEVLDHVRFVQDHVVPRLSLENMCVAASKRIRRDANVEVELVVPALTQLLPPLGRAVVSEDLETGEEFLEFHLPIHKDTGWHDYQVRTPDTPIARQMCQECDSLDGFTGDQSAVYEVRTVEYIPKPHLIC